MRRPDETDDEALDRMWRARYGQPLPVLGGGEFARKILNDWMTPREPERPSFEADAGLIDGDLRAADLAAPPQA